MSLSATLSSSFAIPKVASLPTRGQAASTGKSGKVDVVLEDMMAWEQVHGKGASGKALDGRKMPAMRTMQDEEVAHSEAEDTDSGDGGGVDLGADDDSSVAFFDEEMEDEGSEFDSDDEEDEEESEEATSGSESGTGEAEDNNLEPGPPSRTHLDAFRKYCMDAPTFEHLEMKHIRGIKLMHILKQKKTSLKAYDDLMRWHLEEMKLLEPGQQLGDSSKERKLTYLRNPVPRGS